MCEANDELNSNATWLCQKSLNGQDMGGSLQGEGWTAYLLSGSNVGRFGSVADEIRKTCNQTEGCSATVNKDTGEVTTTQCDTAARSNTIITYDEDGNKTGYIREQCESVGIFSNCICLPPASGTDWYKKYYDESRNLLSYQGCVAREDNGTCKGYVDIHNTWEGSKYVGAENKRAVCSTVWDGKEGTCSSFESGYEGGHSRTSDQKVAAETHYECGTFNADGSCKTYKVNLDTPNISTYYRPDGSPVYYGNSSGYFYTAYCTSFVGKTCQGWKTRLVRNYGQIVESGWKTCTTLQENGSC